MALTVLGLGGCHQGTVPLPEMGPHQQELESVVVASYPPPPPAQESLDLRPEARAQRPEDCVWLDGFNRWTGGRWHWEPGLWVVPPPGCYYAPSELFWQEGEGHGTLIYREPGWYPSRELELQPERCSEPAPCVDEENAG